MNELVLANREAHWRRLKMLVLDSVSEEPILKYGISKPFASGRTAHLAVRWNLCLA
jgi:hypothetical protein